ncbi:hypothetical protein DFH09DRAFT_1084579 [Mycena vulgaris]|nr:hypothetical protein DFH09DRAFT_1084579 [Mycena vulgaris]
MPRPSMGPSIYAPVVGRGDRLQWMYKVFRLATLKTGASSQRGFQAPLRQLPAAGPDPGGFPGFFNIHTFTPEFEFLRGTDLPITGHRTERQLSQLNSSSSCNPQGKIRNFKLRPSSIGPPEWYQSAYGKELALFFFATRRQTGNESTQYVCPSQVAELVVAPLMKLLEMVTAIGDGDEIAGTLVQSCCAGARAAKSSQFFDVRRLMLDPPTKRRPLPISLMFMPSPIRVLSETIHIRSVSAQSVIHG